MTNGYDVIGDVHGSIAKLEGLLVMMGYRRTGSGGWRHPEGRTAVFVGDIIDRNPGQVRCLQTVRTMVDDGDALIVLGNHEFNAVCYATPRGGSHLRERNVKNFDQHKTFLTEVPVDSPEHDEWIRWFRTIPMWLDLGGLRVIHACWSDTHIETLRAAFGGPTLSNEKALALAATKETAEYDAIEVILKGPEVKLPEGQAYKDKDGHLREKARYKWWGGGAMTLRDRAIFIPGSKDAEDRLHPGFGDDPIPNSMPVPDHRTPVIVGHYWNTGELELLSPRAACVDFSAGKEGPLVAYRWTGETDLDAANLIAFPPPVPD
jgi:hypothetical protein